MNTALWIVQILLALAFLLAGLMKATQPVDRLATRMGWVNDFQPHVVRLIGAVEILGAIGMILPALTGIAPVLTPIAAAGLVIVMVGAMVVHAQRNEFAGHGMINVVLLLLAAFVVYG